MTWTSFSIVAGRFLRRLEERADVDVEAEIGGHGGDHLGAAVVAVLAELATRMNGRGLPPWRTRRPACGCANSSSSSYAAVHTGDRRITAGSPKTSPSPGLADSRPGASPRSTARAGCRRPAPLRVLERLGHALGSLGLHPPAVRLLPRTSVLSMSWTSIGLISQSSTDHADGLVITVGTLGTPPFDAPSACRLDRLGHAAELLDLFDQLPCLVGEALRERLDVVGRRAGRSRG
jgi:hypothetical protein